MAILLAAAPPPAAPAAGPPVRYDMLFRDARLLDGTGAAPTTATVAVKDGRIAEVWRVSGTSGASGGMDGSGAAPTTVTAAAVIDCDGRYLAPGFIDVHTHCEGDLSTSAGAMAENFLRMGVTSVITGNCGGSAVALGESFTSYTRVGLGINVASLVGHGSVRARVMGNVNRDPTTTELVAMRALVAEGMADGALGLSTGLIYTPGLYSKTPELVELAKEAAAGGGIYATHMRSEGADIRRAIDEALTIGLQAKCPVQISHFKITAPRYHGQSTMTIAMVEAARAAGQDVTVDQYLYTASSTTLQSVLPDWAVEGTTTQVKERLRDPATRPKIIAELIASRRDRGSMHYAKVASFRADRTAEGSSILELAKRWHGTDTWEAQATTVLDMVTSGGAGMVFHSMDETDVQRIAKYPHTMFASDSGVRTLGSGVPHPRGYGNNARALARYTRGARLFAVEECVRKMTSLPAAKFGMADRGTIRTGAAADLVVFDLAKVEDPSTFDSPHKYAEGFDWVVVNGVAAIAEGNLTGARAGKILKGPARTAGGRREGESK